ncbi:Reverse transcriptase (RNA-dependent DNA polymerase), partial [Phytophthora infestans]
PTDRTSAPTEDDQTRERNAALFPTAIFEELNEATDLTRRRRSERISSRNIEAAFLAMTEWSEWEKAIRVEIEALGSNGTFTLVTPPTGAHVIGTTMNFRVKRHADGKVERLRARVCAQGFQEIYMIGYIDTYVPVARLVSIRVFLAECNQSGLLIRQGDVPTAFVKANLRELIYVKQLRGFEEGEPGQAWLLRKALYGLKQAVREWYIELDNVLRSTGLEPTRENPCVYKHQTKVLIVLVYVDDILVGYKNIEDMQQLMNALEEKYQIKDLGEL